MPANTEIVGTHLMPGHYRPGGNRLLKNIPFKGTPKLYRHDASSEERPALHSEAKVCVLDLSEAKDRAEYQDILTACAAGQSNLMQEQTVYDQEEHKFKCFITYLSLSYQNPEDAKRRILELS